ncbi:MAG: HAD family hydrolase [Candidatus Saccharicenans sp.]
MNLKVAIFDLDGTVVENSYDWPFIRKELGVEGGSILAYLNSLPEPLRSEKYALLEEHEKNQTEKAGLKPGTREFLNWLKAKKLCRALVTNNSQKNTSLLLNKFNLDFDLVLTRESGLYKPTGAPFLRVLEHFQAKPEETVVIGDTHYDLLAAKEAGISLVFILKSQMTPENLEEAELVSSFKDIEERLKILLAKATQ